MFEVECFLVECVWVGVCIDCIEYEMVCFVFEDQVVVIVFGECIVELLIYYWVFIDCMVLLVFEIEVDYCCFGIDCWVWVDIFIIDGGLICVDYCVMIEWVEFLIDDDFECIIVVM